MKIAGIQITGIKAYLISSTFSWYAFTFLGAFYVSHPGNISRPFFTAALINLGISIILFIVWVKSKKINVNK